MFASPQTKEMVMIETTKQERELLDHAIGSRKTQKRRKAKSLKDCFRNHFVASPGTGDDLVWRKLEAKGLATLISGPQEMLPYNIYAVTETGFKELD